MTLADKSPVGAFWRWFAAHEERLFHHQAHDGIISELGQHLRRIHGCLGVGVGPIREGQRRLVISAGGMQEAFPAVEQVFDAAPPMPRWIVVKFRQRRPRLTPVQLEAVLVRPQEVAAALMRSGTRIGVALLFGEAVAHSRQLMDQAGWLLLDHALGEYDVAMRLSHIEFLSACDHRHIPSFPLSQLARRFDRLRQRLEAES